MDTFKYNSYRELIEAWMCEDGENGSRVRLAKAAQCSPSWMTRVLNGSVHLTPDQALGISQVMSLNDIEIDYFLRLVDLERASTFQLKRRLQKRIDDLRREGRQLASSIKMESLVPDKNSIKYYSTWLFSAVHVACMVGIQTTGDIARQFSIAESLVNEILLDLKEWELVEKDGKKWKATSKNFHLRADHPVSRVAHMVWRNRTIQHLFEGYQDGLHYSAIHCLSMNDMEKIRSELKNNILNCRNIIERSPSEKLAVLCVDWYQLSDRSST